MAVIIEKVGAVNYTVNGKKIEACIEGWHTSETLNADERKSWIDYYRSVVTPVKYNHVKYKK